MKSINSIDVGSYKIRMPQNQTKEKAAYTMVQLTSLKSWKK